MGGQYSLDLGHYSIGGTEVMEGHRGDHPLEPLGAERKVFGVRLNEPDPGALRSTRAKPPRRGVDDDDLSCAGAEYLANRSTPAAQVEQAGRRVDFKRPAHGGEEGRASAQAGPLEERQAPARPRRLRSLLPRPLRVSSSPSPRRSRGNPPGQLPRG